MSLSKESEVSAAINKFLDKKGWRVHRTPADVVKHPAGHKVRFYPMGFPDYLCTRAVDPGVCEVFYREDKSPRAQTQKDRRIAQMAFAEMLREMGYLVYVAPEKADQFEAFIDWYETNFDGSSSENA
jgi:hypothetical protein